MTSTPLPSRIELRSGRCWVLARSAWCRWRSGHAKPVSGSMNEHRDGGFEAVLAFAQLTAVRRTAEGAGRGECHIGQHPHLGVARDELYPEPGSFRGGAQAVTLDAGREVVASGCISLVMEPQGNEPSLELSHSAGESAAGTGLLVPEPLAALEGLGALRGTALEEIGGEGPQQGRGDTDETSEESVHADSRPCAADYGHGVAEYAGDPTPPSSVARCRDTKPACHYVERGAGAASARAGPPERTRSPPTSAQACPDTNHKLLSCTDVISTTPTSPETIKRTWEPTA